MRLLSAVDFRVGRDRLWLAGDLVNRGPESLETLRWLVNHDAHVTCVLGNHDLHLLACDRGFRKHKGKDTLQPILDAPDKHRLMDWLRHRPLLVQEGPFTMVHGGLAPDWDLTLAKQLAREVETSLQGPDADALLALLRGPAPTWRADLHGPDRLLAAIAVLTRMRTCTADGQVTGFVGPPEDCPQDERPWYAWRDRPGTLLFGHWAAHGHRVTERHVSLDSGAVWGGKLTAYRLEDRASVQVDAGS